jgi:predicted PurR-regulated permease PerM
MSTHQKGSEHPLSFKALGRVVIVGLIVLLAWKAQSILVSILIALILATAVFPLVERLKKRMPILPATILIFFLLLIPFILLIIFIVPNFIQQVPDMVITIRESISHFSLVPNSIRTFDLVSYIGQHTSNIVNSTTTVALSIFSVITVLFLTFYFVLDHERFLRLFLEIFPEDEQNKVKRLLVELAQVNGKYIRGNLIISAICATVFFITLMILNVPYALPLAIFAGILDLLPLIGSTLGSLPALIIAFAISPIKGLILLGVHLLYQQTENTIISPLIYNKALSLSPALSFLSIVIGAGLFGILGAFLALPVAASIPPLLRFARDYSERSNHLVTQV